VSTPKIRIICDAPDVAEVQINELYGDYQLLTLNISMRGDRPLITAVMIHRSEVPRGVPQVVVPIPGGPRH